MYHFVSTDTTQSPVIHKPTYDTTTIIVLINTYCISLCVTVMMHVTKGVTKRLAIVSQPLITLPCSEPDCQRNNSVLCLYYLYATPAFRET